MNKLELGQNDTIIKTEIESIKNQCNDTGKKMKRKCWSDDEIYKLKTLYEVDGKSLSELNKIFINRTDNSIHLKIKRLKLRHTSEQKRFIWSSVRVGDKNPQYGKIGPTKGLTKHTHTGLKMGGEKLSKIIKEKTKRGEWGAVG